MPKFFALFLCLLSLSYHAQAKHSKVKPGYWHGEFILNANQTLPFTFEIEKEKQLSRLYIINADERIELRDISSKGDSLFISFSAFASEFKAKIIDKKHIQGEWYNYAKKNNYKIPFTSERKNVSRFQKTTTPSFDVNGKWEVTFGYLSDDPYKSIGIFGPMTNRNLSTDDENTIKGTFLTETGDYRFLEGVSSADSLYLSTFDGSHAFLFTAKYENDTLWGDFYSGTHYHDQWFAVKNHNFQLTNPDSLTYVVNDSALTFSLPDLNNQVYNYPNKNTMGKVTLIQIMGTWCPNCLDESTYLKDLYEKFKDDLNIIAITFETQKTQDEKIKKVKRFKEHLGLEYTFLMGGDACKKCAKDMFPMVNNIISFPTLIFVDKKGMIRKIHTGFNGPGTGGYYTEFMIETDKYVEALIKE